MNAAEQIEAIQRRWADDERADALAAISNAVEDIVEGYVNADPASFTHADLTELQRICDRINAGLAVLEDPS